ncbi:MAG TPA: hypothetical protein VLF20_04470, partial [Patescibacteria group bacterium]|nr:hypothetical protein [Patescibacteria group bacterium]
EPDFHDAKDVTEYLQKLQQIVRYLDVSNADMEKGEMRLEPNISLALTSSLRGVKNDEAIPTNLLPNYKVEVKNINSFRFVGKAIEFEITRQTELLEKGERPAQETRGYDNIRQKTFSQRSKEDAQDYRYFPEPDIPPIITTKAQIEVLKSEMPEMPDVKLKRFEKEYTLPFADAEILTRERALADYFEETVEVGKEHKLTAKHVANWIINKKVTIDAILPATLIKELIAATQTVDVDENELAGFITDVIKENEKAVADYKSGKETVIMFLVGMVMRKVGKKIDAQLVKEKLLSHLK